MQAVTALVIDDEPQIRRAVRRAIEGDVARVLEAAEGRAGIDMAAAEQPSLIILDLGLHDLDGLAVLREIRTWSSAAVIVLSARHSDREKVALLEAGADDYVTKPFSPDELRARVRGQLRRAERTTATRATITRDGLTIDLAHRSVARDGVAISLTRTEWEILRVLVNDAGRPLTHGHLFREVWDQPAGDPQQYLRVHISNLRHKIERDPLRPRLIITEPGVGYRFSGGEPSDA